MNFTPNNNIESSNYPGERVNLTVQSHNNNTFIKRLIKNSFVFYVLMCLLSLFFLIFSRNLVKTSFIYHENQKYRLLNQKEEEDNKEKISRMLQAENIYIDENDSNYENVNSFFHF